MPKHPDMTIDRDVAYVDPETKFRELASAWRRNTQFYSSISDIVLDPNYQRIIGMGAVAVPYILQELEKGPDHWYWALAAITDADPAADAPAGDIAAICQAWLNWGREQGLIASDVAATDL